MQKQKKQFVILCVVLVAFVAVFFGLKALTKHQEEKEAEKEEAEKITVAALNTEDISEFSYQYEGTTIIFVKEEDVWYYKEDKSIPITQTMIETMLSNMEKIVAEQKIADPEDISQYGLEEPSNVIELQVGESTFTVTIGMQNEFTSQYYMMVSDDDNVYLTDSSIYNGFKKSVEDLTEETEEEDTSEEGDTTGEEDTTEESDTPEDSDTAE